MLYSVDCSNINEIFDGVVRWTIFLLIFFFFHIDRKFFQHLNRLGDTNFLDFLLFSVIPFDFTKRLGIQVLQTSNIFVYIS